MVEPENIEDIRRRHAEILGELEDLYSSHPQLSEESPAVFRALSQESSDASQPSQPDSPPYQRASPADYPGFQIDSEPEALEPPQQATQPTIEDVTPMESADYEAVAPDAQPAFQWRSPDPQGQLDLSDAYKQGERDPERAELRETGDMISQATSYSAALISLIRQMQHVALEAMAELEEVRARFQRMP